MTVTTISPYDFNELPRDRVEVIDVRTPMEFQEIHISGARNIPLDALDPAAVIQNRGPSHEPLYVVCRSGARAKKACEQFIAAGLTNVVNVEGGTLACEQAGLPMIRGQKVMSLERQVRIAAGSLVLLGAVLGFLVDTAFFGLSAFVGAGLVFAGVTDTCGMGMLLARMPWNKVANHQPAACSIENRKAG